MKIQPQLPLFNNTPLPRTAAAYRERLIELLQSDLDFHAKDSSYLSHNFHAFPAKFPPQLPRKFIEALTMPGDVVLDPMMGSGTTILEAFLGERQAIGCDIDPLALRIASVKVTPLNDKAIQRAGKRVLGQARQMVQENKTGLKRELREWANQDSDTYGFVDEWFDLETQIDLLALRNQIRGVPDPGVRSFLEIALSAIIITKSGGVSLALDLAHTRPHKAKVIIDRRGKKIVGEHLTKEDERNITVLTKTLRSPLDEFEKRFYQNLKSISNWETGSLGPRLLFGNAQALPIRSASVDLIVTSPPYASNAIDYMRAHKFSLVWLGYPLSSLSQKRREYIGGETLATADLLELPGYAKQIISEVSEKDAKKGRVLHLYYSEMTRVLQEMHRVLKPGKAAIVVVGSNLMRGRDVETEECLAAIGKQIGFEIPLIGTRSLDRNRRMLPAGMEVNLDSQIQQRMHFEYVIPFYKPNSPHDPRTL